MAFGGQLSPEQIADIKGAFLMFDRNGDGVISFSELEMVLRALGEPATEEQMERIERIVDRDRNGNIDFEEFLRFIVGKISASISTREDVLKAFREFDTDGNGFITKAELVNIFTVIGQNMTIEDAEKIIAELDADKDGRINYAEFVNKMMPEGSSKGTAGENPDT